MTLDHDSIVRLMLRDRAKLLAYLYSILRNDHAAEDIYQDISILAIRKSGEIESAEHLMGWARQAARFKAMHWLRDQSRHAVSISDDVLDMLESQWRVFDPIEQYDLHEALDHCMDELSPSARRVFELRYVDNLDGETVAARCNMTLRSVYTAVSRAHRALAACMKRQMHGPPVGHIGPEPEAPRG